MLHQIRRLASQYTGKSPRPEGFPEQVYQIFHHKYDIVIIGGGVSGLYSAINLSSQGYSTAIITKTYPTRSNSCSISEGLNAIYSSKDDWNYLYQATLQSSKGLNSPAKVEDFCKSTSEIIKDLSDFGFPFDRNSDGGIKTSANPENPFITWAKAGQQTGHCLLQTLNSRALRQNVRLLSDYFALELIVQGNECKGVVAWNLADGSIHVVQGSGTVLASGGYGKVFGHSSQSQGSTGDGNSLVARAGLPNQNLEFVKYKPLTLAGAGSVLETSLLHETCRLVNRNHEEFIQNLEEDQVCLSMADEIQRGRGAGSKQDYLYLDVGSSPHSHLSLNVNLNLPYLKHFPQSQLLPVRPGAYRTLGGVPTNGNYQVLANDNNKVVENLFAIGQVASSSVNGGNLHIGNNLIESLFTGKDLSRAFKAKYKPGSAHSAHSAIPSFIHESAIERLEQWRVKKGNLSIFSLKKKLQNIVSRFAGVVKNKESIEEGLQKINEFWVMVQDAGVVDRGLKFNLEVLEALELENMVIVAKQMMASALVREESRGCFFREDFEKESEDCPGRTLTWLQSPDGDVGVHSVKHKEVENNNKLS